MQLISSPAVQLVNLLVFAPPPRVQQGAQMSCVPRRAVLAAAAATVAAPPLAALAANDPNDATRLQKGLTDIDFLLDNWDRETTNPNTGDREPDRVRVFLGLRTTTSPLFQSEKLLAKVQSRVDDDKFEDWIEAVEGWNSHVSKVNELAYTSSFGEYNPGGGKDQVQKYLDLAKAEVIEARGSLKTLISILKL